VISVLFTSVYSWGGNKIYTNEDLEQYREKPNPSISVIPEKSISYDELMRRSGKLQPVIQASDFNTSFDQLYEYIEQNVTDKRPEYQKYHRPLFQGMSQEQVKQLWGPRILRGAHEQNEDKTWSRDIKEYEIGISLYFENNKLQGWKIFNNPQSNPPKQTRKEGQVLIYVSGCPTLQDAIDNKTGSNGSAVFWIERHGRTTEEICETVGQGCRTCNLLQEK